MFKNIVLAALQSEAGRDHLYFCPPDTPPEEAYHILGLIRANLFEQIKEIEAAQAKENEGKEEVQEAEVEPVEDKQEEEVKE